MSLNKINCLIAAWSPGFFLDCLFGVANQLKIKTLILEWVITNPYRFIVRKEFIQRSNESKIKKIILLVKYTYYRLLEKIISLISRGQAEKIGVINQFSYNVFKRKGVREEKITVVGYVNFDLAKKTLDLLNNNLKLRRERAKKYNIELDKKNIVVYSTPLHGPFSQRQSIEYYYQIIKTIREVFSIEEADILFKLHPKEENIDLYSHFKNLGVKLYPGNTPNEELIYFSDLYIDHWATTNFISLVMGKNSIFLNLVDFKYVDLYKEIFSIKKFISDKNEFKNLLIDFKNGQLVRQYTQNSIINDGKCIERIIKWID